MDKDQIFYQAPGARMYDYQNRNLGLFSLGKADFENIIMRKREDGGL